MIEIHIYILFLMNFKYINVLLNNVTSKKLDTKSDTSDGKDDCNKIYNESTNITGGITHITCSQNM